MSLLETKKWWNLGFVHFTQHNLLPPYYLVGKPAFASKIKIQPDECTVTPTLWH